MRLAICDDEPRELERMVKLLDEYRCSHDAEIECRTFSNGMDLLSEVKGGIYDLVFLDVLMPGLSGLQVARELREQDKIVRILFLTASPEFAVESYSVGAYHYLLKPATAQTLFPVLDRVLGELTGQEESCLALRAREGVIRIPLSRLEYVEVMNKTVSFHLSDGSVREVSAALADFEDELLTRTEFLKVHRSYLINLRHVQVMSAKGAVTRAGHTVPVSRSMYNQVKESYMRFLFQADEAAHAPSPAAAPPPAPPQKREDGAWRFLLVDDDPDECAIWGDILRSHGCTVDTASCGDQALRLATEETFDCVVLDVMLSEENGFTICQQLRTVTGAPILFLSCLTDMDHQLQGFSAGGIDYITKDTPPDLFWAKVEARAIASRAERIQLRFGPLLLDLSRRSAMIEQEDLALTPIEFDLLWRLSEHAERIYTPEELYRAAWGSQQWDGGRTVQVHMSRLRRKLERAYPSQCFIETVWGQGYRFLPGN